MCTISIIMFSLPGAVFRFSRLSNPVLCSLNSYFCSYSNKIEEKSESIISSSKFHKSGYINCIHLLGTVRGIQKDVNRNWALIFLKTEVQLPDSDNPISEECSTDETDHILRSPLRSIRSSNRIHVFKNSIVLNLRDAKLGDRLFISGFLSYYFSTSKLENSETKPHKLCTVVAQEVAYMGNVLLPTDS